MWSRANTVNENSLGNGDKIGDYRLVRRLGSGQDGEVWAVDRESLAKRFAMKILRGVESKGDRERFGREIDILAALDHPNIVTIVDRGEVSRSAGRQPVPYYVMEYLEAATLDAALAQVHGEKTCAVLCHLLSQVTGVLAAAHEKGITHGDVKPRNIMVREDPRFAKLTDFGFGLLPGDESRRREEYPPSSYRAPSELTRFEADIFKLGRTLQDCVSVVEERLGPRHRMLLNWLAENLIREPRTMPLELARHELDTMGLQPAREGPLTWTELTDSVEEMSSAAASMRIRSPYSGDIGLTERCGALLDSVLFQRAHRLPEFSIAQIILPTASSTYLQVSLERFAMVLRYVRHLAERPEFTATVEPHQLRTALLVALAGNIGEYAYSSQVLRATGKRAYDPLVRARMALCAEPLRTLVASEWEVEPSVAATLLSGTHPEGRGAGWETVLSVGIEN